MPVPTRAILKVTTRCNQRCRFCRVTPLRGQVPDPPAADVMRKAAVARDLGAAEILLSGGEPTMRADLPAIARAIRAMGLGFGLVTNGRRLAYRPYRDRLLSQGLAYVHTSLHGASAATHDAVACDGGFRQVMAAIDGLRGTGVDLHVNTVVCGPNVAELAAISDLLAPRGPLTHKLCLAEPRGAFAEHETDLLVRPDDVGRACVDAVVRARAAYAGTGLATVVEGFPLCQVRGAEDALSGLRSHGILWMSEPDERDLFPTDDGERTYPPACAACGARARCPGVYVGYAERFGAEGLAAYP